MSKQFSRAALLAVSGLVAGSALADATDPLTLVQPPQSEWSYANGGAPDYVVEVPAFTVPATGVIDYVNTVIPLDFPEDRWVKALQFIPGDKRVLHHLLAYVVAADEDNEGMLDETVNDDRREFLEGYAPGKENATEYPAGTGVFIPTGSAIRMSVHYTAFGLEVDDSTRIGLWFYPEDELPQFEYHTYAVSPGAGPRNIVIPPGAMNHEMAASHVFDKDIVLHGFRAHMHYRGKAMSARVIYPDNTSAEIINVANYNFGWQPTYRLAEPMILPAGSRVVVEGTFDNSEYNLGVPDPTVPAVGGLQSWDEMFIGYFSYHDYVPKSVGG